MTDRAISVGDLVQVVGCDNPDAQQYLGSVRIVAGHSTIFIGNFYLDPPTQNCFGSVISWFPRHLKRIPPLDELESTKTDEPMKEPA